MVCCPPPIAFNHCPPPPSSNLPPFPSIKRHQTTATGYNYFDLSDEVIFAILNFSWILNLLQADYACSLCPADPRNAIEVENLFGFTTDTH
ncbi:hypothetical protein LINPERHAP2_LOCUS32989 [Linum perenne]